MGLLDDAIARSDVTAPTSKMGRVLAALQAHPKFPAADVERLNAMLAAPLSEWGHPQLAAIITDVCAELDIPAEGINKKNVGDWRLKARR